MRFALYLHIGMNHAFWPSILARHCVLHVYLAVSLQGIYPLYLFSSFLTHSLNQRHCFLSKGMYGASVFRVSNNVQLKPSYSGPPFSYFGYQNVVASTTSTMPRI